MIALRASDTEKFNQICICIICIAQDGAYNRLRFFECTAKGAELDGIGNSNRLSLQSVRLPCQLHLDRPVLWWKFYGTLRHSFKLMLWSIYLITRHNFRKSTLWLYDVQSFMHWWNLSVWYRPFSMYGGHSKSLCKILKLRTSCQRELIDTLTTKRKRFWLKWNSAVPVHLIFLNSILFSKFVSWPWSWKSRTAHSRP